MKCINCGNELKTIKTIDTTYENGINIAIVNTPLLYCDCGESYYHCETTNKLNSIIDGLDLDNSYTDLYVINYENGEALHINQ